MTPQSSPENRYALALRVCAQGQRVLARRMAREIGASVSHAGGSWSELAAVHRQGSRLAEAMGQDEQTDVAPETVDWLFAHLMEGYQRGTAPAQACGPAAADAAGGDPRPAGLAPRVAAAPRRRSPLAIRSGLQGRLTTVGKLTAGVAHEVNNLLAFVQGNLALAARSVEELSAQGTAECDAASPRRTPGQIGSSPQWRDLRDLMRDACVGVGHIAEIVSDLNSVARVDDDAFKPVDVNEIVAFACRVAGNSIRPRARLQVVPGEIGHVRGNRVGLGQVVLNLLLNAAEATPEGDSDAHTITVRTAQTPRGVELTVRDTGRGVPVAIRDRIFDPFFSTSTAGKHAGLGLAMCADIVDRHRGSIHLEDVPGPGSCFTVVLPTHSDAPIMQSEPIAPEVTARETRGRVLVVDDDPMVRKLLCRFLGKAHVATPAPDGQHALQLLREGQDFDAVVCDLAMPGMDGPALFEAACQLAPWWVERFIFVSGGAYTARCDAFIAGTTAPVLAKPIDRRAVMAAVEQVMASSRCRLLN